MAKKNNYKEALKLLEQLHQKYPSYTIGRHIYTAMSDYGDFWGITDKEFCFALEKYISELELDNLNLAPQEYVEKIIASTNELFQLEEEETEDGY